MTRAGEKLHPEPEPRRGSVFRAFVAHPETRRGFRDVGRVLALVLLVRLLFGLG